MLSARKTHRFVMNCRLWHMVAFAQMERCFFSTTITRQNPMRLKSAIAFLTLFAVACAADAAPSPSPHQVDIPLGNRTLHAQLYNPDGDGPLPVVTALYGWGRLDVHSAAAQPSHPASARP